MQERNLLVIIIQLILQFSYSVTLRGAYPEQIHISLGNHPEEMVITWITFASTGASYVWYGTISEGLNLRAEGYSTKFQDEGENKVVRYIHRVVLQCLKPNTFYVYRCGSYHGVSQAYIFKMSPRGTDWSPRLIVFGDMGWKGAAVLPYIQEEVSDYDVDAIVHVGDIAYNMDSYDGYVGDQFLRMIQPVASRIPYMTAVGNHEQAYNFSHYKNKFSMPGRSEGFYYSFDLGPAHFVTVSTEVYYFSQYGFQQIFNQYNWLQHDLKRACKRKNRSQRPWVIVFGHRPFYCSSDTAEDCSLENSVLRCCNVNSCDCGLENLYHRNKVDLTFSGHMHYYERSWPLYNSKVFNGTCQEPYRNPGASVHIITGAAGMQCGTETASYIRRDWFPFYSSEYSYTVLTVNNHTHLHVEQVSASRGGEVIDSMWLIKDSRHY